MNREELLRNTLERVYCRIMPSARHGVGVFAIRDIPAGVDPFQGCSRAPSVRFRPDELADLHPEVRRMVDDYFAVRGGYVLFCRGGLNAMDIQYYVNHSEQPNVRSSDDHTHFLSQRAIPAGEELTVDYATYNDPPPG